MAEYSQKWHNGTSRGRSTETSDGIAAIQAQLNNLGREIKKVNEKIYVAQVGCKQCKGPHYTKDCLQKEETLEEAYYTQSGGPFQGGGYRATTPGMELDLEARHMGETLVLNRSLDPFLEDYIELNDLNKPFELRRNQGDDLMTTIEECEIIEEFRARDEDLDTGINDYPRALMNVPIFVGTFSVMTDFAVLEDMDAYRDEGMGDLTYQMVRSHPRFKNHTNEQFNKIPPLLKDPIIFEMQRWKNGSHAGTLACMRPNKEEAEEKSNLKTSL
ncbi:hypothetical protein Tco_0658873 [Tanacetum coccineum]